jgi:hypothetical protein
VPVTLSVLQAQQISSDLLPANTYTTPAVTQSGYTVYIYSTPPKDRSSYIFTSRRVSTQKITTVTTTTSTTALIETSSPIATTIFNDISTVVSTIPTDIITDVISTTDYAVIETSTKQTETDETTSSIDLLTTSEIIQDTTSSTDEMTTTQAFEETTSFIDKTSASEQTDQTTSFNDLTTISGSSEKDTYATDLTTLSIESSSTETSSLITNTASEFVETTSSSSVTDFTREETSTNDLTGYKIISDETETTSSNNFVELTSPVTDNLSTINDITTTMESYLSETTISQAEETSSKSSTETPLATSLYDYSTQISDISTVSGGTTNEIETDTSTTEMPELQSSTISSYTEETSLSPIYLPTTVKLVATTARSTFKTGTPTSFYRQTTKKISPFLTYKSSLPTSSLRKTSLELTTRSISTMKSIKPGLTRKQTSYSTAFVFPTTQRYGTSLAVTSKTTYRPTTTIRGQRFTTATTPLGNTGRTSKFYN